MTLLCILLSDTCCCSQNNMADATCPTTPFDVLSTAAVPPWFPDIENPRAAGSQKDKLSAPEAEQLLSIAAAVVQRAAYSPPPLWQEAALTLSCCTPLMRHVGAALSGADPAQLQAWTAMGGAHCSLNVRCSHLAEDLRQRAAAGPQQGGAAAGVPAAAEADASDTADAADAAGRLVARFCGVAGCCAALRAQWAMSPESAEQEAPLAAHVVLFAERVIEYIPALHTAPAPLQLARATGVDSGQQQTVYHQLQWLVEDATGTMLAALEAQLSASNADSQPALVHLAADGLLKSLSKVIRKPR